MIVVVDSIKGNSGQGVAMYSRAGKSTINQYLAFASKNEGGVQRFKSEEDETTALLDDEVNRELQLLLQKEEIKKVLLL